MLFLSSLLLLVAWITDAACVTVVAYVPVPADWCWRLFSPCVLTVADLPAIVCVPGVVDVPAFIFIPVVAGVPADADDPAVDGFLFVASVPDDLGIPILASVFMYCTL